METQMYKNENTNADKREHKWVETGKQMQTTWNTNADKRKHKYRTVG